MEKKKIKDRIRKLFEHLPDNEKLSEALGEIFTKLNSKETSVFILERKKNPYTSTHPSEIVKCKVSGNIELDLFLKYEIEGHSNINSHRNKLDYENNIYTQVLSPIAMSTPKYYGKYSFNNGNLKLLVIEYLKDLVKFQKSKDSNVIFEATRWLGEFHYKSKDIIINQQVPFINEYKSEYYLKWPQVTLDRVIESNLGESFTWLQRLVDKFKYYVSDLTDGDPVIIHGEFYPTNVRYKDGTLYPLDWQTAAIAVGEIDFATLTENWSEEIEEKCLEIYVTVSQSNEPLNMIRRRVLLSRIYINFLWLHYFPKAITQGNYYLDQLKYLETKLQ